MSFPPQTVLVKLNTALWLPIFDFGRQYWLDMSKYVWKTPHDHTIYFCIFWIFECISLMYTTINQKWLICQADTPWKFLLGLKWWVIFCNAIKSEWEYSSSFVQPSPSKFLFRVWFICLILTLNIAIMQKLLRSSFITFNCTLEMEHLFSSFCFNSSCLHIFCWIVFPSQWSPGVFFSEKLMLQPYLN